MNEQNENPAEIFMHTVIDKLDRQEEKSQIQDKRLTAVENRIGDTFTLVGDISNIKADIRTLAEKAAPQKFPKEMVQELNMRLDKGISVLSHPLKSEVHHHHHFPAIAWATAGLFLVLCLVSTGWLMTSGKLNQSRAGDFKYRYLKLFTDSASSAHLFRLDSLYEVNPDSFKNVVLTQERLKQERLELLDQIHSVDDQIGGLQDKAGEKKKSKN